MKPLKLYFITFLLIAYTAKADNHGIDSLFTLYDNAKTDSARISYLIDIGMAYELISYDSSFVYYNKALNLAQNAKNEGYQSVAKRFIGNLYIDVRKYDKALDILSESLEIAKLTDNKAEIARAYLSMGLVYNNTNDYIKALDLYNQAIEIAKNIKDSVTLSYSYNNIGLAYYNQYNYEEALKYYLLSVDIDEQLGDLKGVSQGYINIGLIHYSIGNYDNTLSYYKKAIKIAEELNEIVDMSIGYNNIAIIYKYQQEYEKALEYLYKAVEIDKRLEDKGGVAICYINMGSAYGGIGKHEKAKSYFYESLNIWKEIGDKAGEGTVLYYLSGLYLEIAMQHKGDEAFDKNINMALNYGLLAFEIAEKTNSVSLKNSAANSLLETYSKMGDYESAFHYSSIYVETKNTLINEEKVRSIADAEKKWESEKRLLQIEHLEKEKEIQRLELLRQKEESAKQRLAIILVSTGLLVISALSVFIFKRLRISNRQKKIIQAQNALVKEKIVQLNERNEEIKTQKDEIQAKNIEIEAQRDLALEQKDFIEKQNNAITNSINYARRIQHALLPELSNLTKSENSLMSLSDCFVVYKPKEIVSGDFYWANRIGKSIVIAVADCTGHGVPGSFMSMLGISFMNEIVNKQENLLANEILNQLRDNVSDTLKQAGKKEDPDNYLMDGMNIVIAVIDLENMMLQYSGSYNPLIMVRNNKLVLYPTDKNTIGMFVKKKKDFKNNSISLLKGDMFYMYSDGYIDQFNNDGAERFKYSRFKELLLSINKLSLNEQQEKLETTFYNWKGKNDQIDDITILGFRV